MKVDLKRELRALYLPPSLDFVEVDIPEMGYLAIDGHGDPNVSSGYADAVAALYACAYAIKFGFRARTGDDFVVPPLEGLWSSADPADFVTRRKANWEWTMLIAMPAVVALEDIETGIAKAGHGKPELPVSQVRPWTWTEGRCLQILHLGSYDDEAATLARLHDQVMPSRGLTFNGRHHEIYLSDPRRVPPERLKTVLRQPVRAADASGAV
jgi:hypothetical protein